MKQEFLVGGLVLAGSIAYYLLFKGSKRPVLAPKPLPPIVVDPSVLESRDIRRADLLAPLEDETWRNSVLMAKEAAIDAAKLSAPYELPEFGNDVERNTDPVGLDEFMNLPLVGDGVTWKTRDAYHEADADSEAPPKVLRFRYLRFRVLETRGGGNMAALGGIKFYNGVDRIDDPAATLWNPFSGATGPYKWTDSWSDDDQKQLIIKFSRAVAVNRYQTRTSTEDGSEDKDPVRWVIEGSQNGTYWLALDERTKRQVNVPLERGVWKRWQMPRTA